MTMSVDAAWARRWIELAAAEGATQRDYLVDLDRAIGDGDHGENMDRGVSAAPAPWTAREEITHTRAAGPAGVAPHRRLPAANTAIPASMTRRYPQESASFPPRGKTAAAARR